MLETGGDFADGVIAHEGARLAGEVFLTLDRDVGRLAEQLPIEVELLSAR